METQGPGGAGGRQSGRLEGWAPETRPILSLGVALGGACLSAYLARVWPATAGLPTASCLTALAAGSLAALLLPVSAPGRAGFSEAGWALAAAAVLLMIAPGSPGGSWPAAGLRGAAALWLPLLIGVWLGRGLSAPAQLLTAVLCASAGDAGLNIPILLRLEALSPDHPLRSLRLAWPPGADGGSGPLWTDFFCVGLFLAAARRNGYRVRWALPGLLAGYLAGVVLQERGVLPFRLGLPLLGFGLLWGLRPRFACPPRLVLRGLGLALALFLLLAAGTLLHWQWRRPAPRPGPSWQEAAAERLGGGGRRAGLVRLDGGRAPRNLAGGWRKLESRT